jgi:mannan endo-1,4-beta-mannosidase
LSILGSKDGKIWKDLDIHPESYTNNESNYGYWKPKVCGCSGQSDFKFIKVVFKGGIGQLARSEILYK